MTEPTARTRARSRAWVRRIVVVALFLIGAVILWVWVFPWLDETYVNRPQIGGAIRR